VVDVRLVVVRNALVHLHYCSWVGRTRKCGRFCQPGIVRVRVFYLFIYVSCWPNIHVKRGPTTAQRPSQRPAIDILVCYLGIFLGERHSDLFSRAILRPILSALLFMSCVSFSGQWAGLLDRSRQTPGKRNCAVCRSTFRIRKVRRFRALLWFFVAWKIEQHRLAFLILACAARAWLPVCCALINVSL